LVATGYAGADFIEGFASQWLPGNAQNQQTLSEQEKDGKANAKDDPNAPQPARPSFIFQPLLLTMVSKKSPEVVNKIVQNTPPGLWIWYLEKIRSDYVSIKVVLQRFELFAGPVKAARTWPQGCAPPERKKWQP
jgi:hypothetical protein